jgi:hypothetical protein
MATPRDICGMTDGGTEPSNVPGDASLICRDRGVPGVHRLSRADSLAAPSARHFSARHWSRVWLACSSSVYWDGGEYALPRELAGG